MRARIVFEEKTRERLERERKRQQMRRRSQPVINERGETVDIEIDDIPKFDPELQRMLNSL